MSLDVLTTRDSLEWRALTQQASGYDFHHLLSFHRLAEERGDGEALMFVYREKDEWIALPLLVRDLTGVPGLTEAPSSLRDATSVYGYPGPMASRSDPSPRTIRGFQSSIQNALESRGVIAVFSRLHPLLQQRALIEGLGEVSSTGQTVSIDLSLPREERVKRYRRDHRRTLNSAASRELACIHDVCRTYLGEFIDAYYETMRRVGARQDYFFSRQYLVGVTELDGAKGHIFVGLSNGEFACGGLYIECGDYISTFLSCRREGYQDRVSTCVLVNSVADWASEAGVSVFHLGGGLHGTNDGVFAFKSGFSDRRHDFYTWRWVLQSDVYDELTKKAERWHSDNRYDRANEFFPAYRAPSVVSQ